MYNSIEEKGTKMNAKIIHENVPLYSSSYTIKDLNEIVAEQAKLHGVDPNTIRIALQTNEYGGECYLYYQRGETDKEKEKRARQEKKLEDAKKKMKEVAEKKELKEYERLKAKFEKRSSPHFMDGK